MKALIIALLTFVAISSAQAEIRLTETHIANAKRAAIEVVEGIARHKASYMFQSRPGSRFSIVDPKDSDQNKFIKVTPLDLMVRKVNRVAVLLSLHEVSADGKVDWFAGGNYRILVDLKDSGEVIAAEVNFFTSLMSYEEPYKPSHVNADPYR